MELDIRSVKRVFFMIGLMFTVVAVFLFPFVGIVFLPVLFAVGMIFAFYQKTKKYTDIVLFTQKRE
ncbi:MAG: hypothetical protein K0Q85_853 [Caproiciproducens sp.]|jgi:hypothetical protein|nr:hypothetical protein [Caproiciproducens sp.]